MKIYGTGTFTAASSSRVIWDFVDGPFDTVNPVLIEHARRLGYSFTPPAPVIEETVTEAPRKVAGRGKKSKGAIK